MTPLGAHALAALQAAFAHFAAHECAEDPVYVALCRLAARHPAWLAPLASAAPTQRRPNLWLAALHDSLLAGAEAGLREPLAAWFPGLGGTRVPDADDPALAAAVEAQLQVHAVALAERIAAGATQTNEIGRCAVLWPLLAGLAERTGRSRLALLDVGCSAGLNLGVDRFGYRYLAADGLTLRAGVAAPTGVPRPPVVESRWIGGALPPGTAAAPPPTIVARLGIDPAPVDLRDAAALRWLRACLWPADLGRRARFDAAVALALAAAWPLRAVADATAAVDDWRAALPADVLPVVFNSWVLTYFEAPARARHVEHLNGLAAAGRIAWISAEMPTVAAQAWPGLPAASAAALADAAAAGIAADEMAGATVWALRAPGADWTLAARSHGHGRWVRFGA